MNLQYHTKMCIVNALFNIELYKNKVSFQLINYIPVNLHDTDIFQFRYPY